MGVRSSTGGFWPCLRARLPAAGAAIGTILLLLLSLAHQHCLSASRPASGSLCCRKGPSAAELGRHHRGMTCSRSLVLQTICRCGCTSATLMLLPLLRLLGTVSDLAGAMSWCTIWHCMHGENSQSNRWCEKGVRHLHAAMTWKPLRRWQRFQRLDSHAESRCTKMPCARGHSVWSLQSQGTNVVLARMPEALGAALP